MDTNSAGSLIYEVASQTSLWRDVLVPLGAALLGALIGAVAAVFGQRLYAWRYHPYIQFLFFEGDEDFECATPDTETGRSFYIRLLVRNNGRETAKGCRVFVQKICALDHAGNPTTKKLTDLLPLSWAARQSSGQEEYSPIDLSVNGDQFIDILAMFPKRVVKMTPFRDGFTLTTRISLLRYGDFLTTYNSLRIHLVVMGDNFNPRNGYFDFEWRGWQADNERPSYTIRFRDCAND